MTDETPLWATPEGQAARVSWFAEDPEGYSQWLDDEWAKEHPDNPSTA